MPCDALIQQSLLLRSIQFDSPGTGDQNTQVIISIANTTFETYGHGENNIHDTLRKEMNKEQSHQRNNRDRMQLHDLTTSKRVNLDATGTLPPLQTLAHQTCLSPHSFCPNPYLSNLESFSGHSTCPLWGQRHLAEQH